MDHREMKVNSSPENIFHAITNLVNQHDWHVERRESNSLIIRERGWRVGTQWIEWRVGWTGREASPRGDCLAYLTQTVFFSPHGLPGFLYWILLYPFHWLRFRGLIREITAQSETQ